MEERSSHGKPWDTFVHIQPVIQPSSQSIIHPSTLCTVKKPLLSFSSSSCQQRPSFTRKTAEHCSRISTNPCHPSQCAPRLSTINRSCSVRFMLFEDTGLQQTFQHHPVFKNSVLTASFCSLPSSCKVLEAKVNVQCNICS